jgi:hypothetical protein
MDTLDFDGMGIKTDVKRQRESWNLTFRSVQIALGFCNLYHVEAEKAVRGLLGQGDLADRVGADFGGKRPIPQGGRSSDRDRNRQVRSFQRPRVGAA